MGAPQIEICYHPNAQVYIRCDGMQRSTIVAIPGVATVNEQIATAINAGAIDRRPGAPAELLGNNAVRYLEPQKII